MSSRRARSMWAALLYAFVSAFSFAARVHGQDYRPEQGIYVLPSTAPGAPSTDDIVTWYYTPPGKRLSNDTQFHALWRHPDLRTPGRWLISCG